VSQADRLFTDGEAYERLMGRWSRIVGEAFLDWLDVARNLRWLDVGCGNGAFTAELIAHCAPAAVSAIDPSDDQLAYARTRPGVKITEFRVGDAENLPFGDGTFDVAVMALLISFLPDPGRAVAEMARVVRRGGWVAAYMWDTLGGGAPVHPIYLALESMGMTSVRPPNPAASGRDAMQFWDLNVVPIGPQGKIIADMSAGARETRGCAAFRL
jgi:ubiquinone/menaquinone biosynthesis C-methylase UbiE